MKCFANAAFKTRASHMTLTADRQEMFNGRLQITAVRHQRTQQPGQAIRTLGRVLNLLAECEGTAGSSSNWLKSECFSVPSWMHDSPHLGTRQYARNSKDWVDELGQTRVLNGTHTMRRTKATWIYKRTKKLRTVQLLLGHSKLESTVRYLGIEVDDTPETLPAICADAPSFDRDAFHRHFNAEVIQFFAKRLTTSGPKRPE